MVLTLVEKKALVNWEDDEEVDEEEDFVIGSEAPK